MKSREWIKNADADDVDGAYRQLAAATVAQALYDYARFLFKPSYEEEKYVCSKQIEMCDAVLKVLEMTAQSKNTFEAYHTIVTDLFLSCKATGETYFRMRDSKRNTATKEKLERATEPKQLVQVVTELRANFIMRKNAFFKRETTLQEEARKIERFVESDDLSLYTDGKVSKDQFYKRAKRIAADWRRKGKTEDLDTDAIGRD